MVLQMSAPVWRELVFSSAVVGRDLLLTETLLKSDFQVFCFGRYWAVICYFFLYLFNKNVAITYLRNQIMEK